ncbi:MAG: pyruvate:ferredoxin (flavodoxin) oxidoreductase [Phycisphaeraceae bacterium]
MSGRPMITLDGNEAAASVAHRLNEAIVIYPITPSSPMGEFADEWSAQGRKNLWGGVPDVVEMQSEAGAIGSVHGSLQAGALTTTFTASQGLLLMIPNLYKIAGELTSFCMHVAARTVATHALSIFGDHSDVMACRQTGVGLLAGGSVQEAQDLAAVGQAATLASRVPMLHFFDGFRTSHEVAKIEMLQDDDLRQLIRDDWIKDHRERALSPDHPEIRGTAQNPDTFFQAREACNEFYDACPEIVQDAMDRFAAVTGRQYRLFDYVGHREAERVIVMMGSGAETAHETIEKLVEQGEKVGLIKVRLFRPFSTKHLLQVLPETTKKIAVLDRTKEPGSAGEPLYQDIVTVLRETAGAGELGFDEPTVVGGRYGLSSKEFTPAMVRGVFDNLEKDKPKNHFTIGINDDVTHTSLPYDLEADEEDSDVVRAVFYGLGSDGTVGANKNSIKIIGEGTDLYAQGYFVYDSKKSGGITISHLRFGPREIRSAYLIRKANFVACHQFSFLDRYDVLETAQEGATFLLNAPYGPDEVWDHLPREVQETIIEKKLKLYVIDGYKIAEAAGMGRRINTIMQTCFFAISGVLPREEAIAKIKDAIEKTYGKKGQQVVEANWAAVDHSLEGLHEVQVPQTAESELHRHSFVPEDAPDFVKRVTALMMENKGDMLPVSAFPVDGTWPTGTSRYEKRGIALELPVWEEDLCIQCNKCAFACPHAAIRPKVYEPEALENAPEGFRSVDYKAPDFKGLKYTLQVSPDDCTGCQLCVNVCPSKDKKNPERKALNMASMLEHREQEQENWDFFSTLPAADRGRIKRLDVKGSQLLTPLFEFSGACAGCGETPYVKLMTQLFGERALIANATGCSSIFGGNLPTTPYCTNMDGRGPAWSNSLFEDNAEFGLGMRLGVDNLRSQARDLVQQLGGELGDQLVAELLAPAEEGEAGIAAQRERVKALREKLETIDRPEAKRLDLLADYLVPKSVWLVGGDGWAYDIGYGGLDHVLSMSRDVNVLVMNTEVYSNTGGQASKATPIGASAKFAAAGKPVGKKDLGLMAMSYGHVYVASICQGANDNQTVKALREAESYPGPSLIIAYAHCIAHGVDMAQGLDHQKMAVDSGVWPLYRFDPRRAQAGQSPLQIDSRKPKIPVREYMEAENRFRMVQKADPERFDRLVAQAQQDTDRRIAYYQQLAQFTMPEIEEAVAAQNGKGAAAR